MRARELKLSEQGTPSAAEQGPACPQAENNFGRGQSKNGVIEPTFATDLQCQMAN